MEVSVFLTTNRTRTRAFMNLKEPEHDHSLNEEIKQNRNKTIHELKRARTILKNKWLEEEIIMLEILPET